MGRGHESSARDLLDFYIEAGADALVGEKPVDRFAAGDVILPARAPNPATARAESAAGTPSPVAPPAPDEAAMAARDIAKRAATLDELRAVLDRMLAAIGLDRTSVYIANIVPWRPPGNRTPTPQESQICLPFISRQIELADPDILVCLGGPSAQTLLGIKEGITKTRGRWFSFDTGKREIRAMPTFHPAFLLRSPLQKRFAWRDFLAIKKALG